MKNTKSLMLCFNNYIIKYINNILQKLFTVISINKSPFRGIGFTILLLIGIVSSILIRLDYVYNILNSLPYELMVSLRLTSALYSILLLFLLIINIRHCLELIKLYISKYLNILEGNNKNLDNSILFLYLLYISFILLITIIISIINYYSIISININYLDIIYIIFSIISLLFGIYYSIYKLNIVIDLNKTLSFTGKICLISFILFYSSLYIGLRTGLILEWFNKLELFKVIHCEGNGPSNDELNRRIRGNESSNNSNIGSNSANTTFSGNNSSINAGDNATVSNVTINPSSNNGGTVTETRTVNTTETITSPISGGNQGYSNVENNSNNPLNDLSPRYSSASGLESLKSWLFKTEKDSSLGLDNNESIFLNFNRELQFFINLFETNNPIINLIDKNGILKLINIINKDKNLITEILINEMDNYFFKFIREYSRFTSLNKNKIEIEKLLIINGFNLEEINNKFIKEITRLLNDEEIRPIVDDIITSNKDRIKSASNLNNSSPQPQKLTTPTFLINDPNNNSASVIKNNSYLEPISTIKNKNSSEPNLFIDKGQRKEITLFGKLRKSVSTIFNKSKKFYPKEEMSEELDNNELNEDNKIIIRRSKSLDYYQIN